MMCLPILDSAHWMPPLVAQARGPHGQQVDIGSMLLWLGAGAAAIGAISVAAYFAHRAALRRRTNSHTGLFDALCQVHQLDRSQRSLLRQVVRVRSMPYPGQVFTEPGRLNPTTLPASLQAKAPDLAKLNKTLFG